MKKFALILTLLIPISSMAYTITKVDTGMLIIDRSNKPYVYTTTDCKLKVGDKVEIKNDQHGNQYVYNPKSNISCYEFTY